MRHAGLAAVVVCACFNPTLHSGEPCSATSPCPTGLVCVPSSQTCEFSLVDGSIDSPSNGDAGSSMGSGAICFGSGFVTTCFTSPPSGSVVLTGAVDTDTDSRCDTAFTATCTIAAQTLATTATVRATGSRPLVLVGAEAVEIEGTLDVASHVGSDNGAAANDSACGSGTSVMAGSLDGAAGGSFATVGGGGGLGADGAPPGKPAAAVVPTALRGGCPGQSTGTDLTGLNGSGGAGGGAVYIIAGTEIVVQGTIDASGAGAPKPGNSTSGMIGGAGGGAGGMVGLDAPSIELAGIVFANGGGGAGGAAATQNTGSAGADPTGVAAAAGGAGGASSDPDGGGGAGGAGAAAGGSGAVGGNGGEDGGAGGGGGGGEGAIVVFGTLVGAGSLSPPPTKN